jgi:hypothetical protein
MQDANPEIMKALEGKLNALVHCVLRQARSDPAFAAQLEEVLLSDSLRTKLIGKKSASPKSGFNPVEHLQAHGQESLRRELEDKPNSELSDVVRFHRIVKGKAAKVLDRTTMVEEILAYAERSLKQGGAFLRDKGRTEAAASPESVGGPDGQMGNPGPPVTGRMDTQPESPVDSSTAKPEL